MSEMAQPYRYHPRANSSDTVATQAGTLIYASARNMMFVSIHPTYKVKQVMGLPAPASQVIADPNGFTVMAIYEDKIALYKRAEKEKEKGNYTRTATIQAPEQICKVDYHEEKGVLVVATVKQIIVYRYVTPNTEEAPQSPRRTLTSHISKHTIRESSLPPPTAHQNTLERIQAMQLQVPFLSHQQTTSSASRSNFRPLTRTLSSSEWKIIWQKR